MSVKSSYLKRYFEEAEPRDGEVKYVVAVDEVGVRSEKPKLNDYFQHEKHREGFVTLTEKGRTNDENASAMYSEQ